MMAVASNLEPAKGWRAWQFRLPEVWMRFLLALVGLVLAFAAALFSTVLRESGNIWATVTLASVALILAGLVGITTVPYLARRVAGARLRNAFDYDVTRAGIFYVLGVLAIAVGALNTGNNLLYIIVAAMLSAILVSGIASASNLRGLELEIGLPAAVFAQRTVAGTVVLRNVRRYLPAFSVSVVPSGRRRARKDWRWTSAVFAFPSKRPPEKQWIRLPDRRLQKVVAAPDAPGIFSGAVYFPFVPARGRAAADLELRFDRRGRYHSEGFGLATRFPFAFLAKTRRVALSRELIVYPPVGQTDQFLEMLPLITGEFETWARGRGNDLYRIREYLPEDSARHVDWKATAKSGSPKVREFTREDERQLRIVFDNPQAGALPAKSYEAAVELAASLAWHFSSQLNQVSFAAQEYSGGADVHEFLHYLALVQAGAGGSVIEGLPPSSDYNIILTTRQRGSIPTALWNCSYFVFLGA
jgi:uncharacterized protein (DUF58 family)